MKGKHVVIVEDLVDTGKTLSVLKPKIIEAGALSARVVVLMEKRTERSCGFKADFCGFSIPDEFVIGYGLDYNQWFRDLHHVSFYL